MSGPAGRSGLPRGSRARSSHRRPPGPPFPGAGSPPPAFEDRADELARLYRSLRRLRISDDPARDELEVLDLLEVFAGTKPLACVYAYEEPRARGLATKLERHTKGRLLHGVRLLPDDRARILEAHAAPVFLVRAFRARRLPLATVWSWRPGASPPPARPEKAELGALLGYPRCCVAHEARVRARVIVGGARAMAQSWGVATTRAFLEAWDAETAFVQPVDPDDAWAALREQAFPHVSFVPCPRCYARGERSPAGRVDLRRRGLVGAVGASLEEC